MKYVSKRNGMAYSSLNYETICFHVKDLKSAIALINDDRILKFNEMHDFIDDITPEEIQAGTQAVKEYCLANNELELLKQYLRLVLSDVELLNGIKEVMFVDIRLKAEKLSRELIVDEVPDSEVATFTTQRSEAIAYRNSGYTNDNLCPMLKIIAEIRSMSLRDLVDKCLLKSSLYETELAKILGNRQKLEDDIKKAQTLEELNLIVW
ncbi:hypothetical protein ACKWT2_001684 [Campylobacter jejuni]